MSDRSIDPYQGLDAAAPAFAAPAFGDTPTAPAPDTPAGAEAAVTAQPSGDSLPAHRPACSNAECANATVHPAEARWQRLVSAVPVERQLYRLRPAEAGMSFPTETDFRAAVGAVRPAEADAHSIERLRNAWSDDVAGRLAGWSEQIKANLNDLSEGWPGTDFDAFEAACGQTRELVDDLIDDIDATVANLQSAEAALYSLQGGDSGEVPYPAPQFWIDGDWHSWVSVHIRPAWWHGDCIEYTCQDAEHVLALGGAEPELATEIIDYIDERILHYVERYASPANVERDGLDPSGLTDEEAKELAVADAMEHYGTLVDQSWGAYESRHTAINGEIGRRSADTDAEQRSVRTVRSDKAYPDAADPVYMDLEVPAMEQPTGAAAPRSSKEPSLEPPSGEAPEDPVDMEEDGEKPGAGTGAPLPSMTTESLAAGALGVATVSVTSSAAGDLREFAPTLGGPNSAGTGTPMEDKDREPDLGQAEDDNLWGFVNEDDDPYA